MVWREKQGEKDARSLPELGWLATYVVRRGRIVEHNINNNYQPWGEEGDFAVHAGVYDKVQAKTNVKPNDQEGRKGRERCLLAAQAELASYLCRLCTICALLSAPRW